MSLGHCCAPAQCLGEGTLQEGGRREGGEQGAPSPKFQAACPSPPRPVPSLKGGVQLPGHSTVSPQRPQKASRPWRWSSCTGCRWEREGSPVAVVAAGTRPAPPRPVALPHSLAGLLTHPDAGLPLVQAPAQLGVAIGCAGGNGAETSGGLSRCLPVPL